MTPPDGCFLVHGSLWLEEGGDVSDMHAQLQSPPWQLTHVQRIIDVSAARRVHTTNTEIPQVLPAKSGRAHQRMDG